MIIIPDKQQDKLQDIAYCAENFFYFAKYHAKTFDPNDQNNPIKLFPADWEYIKYLVMEWERIRKGETDKKGQVIFKTRQLLVSTTAMIYFLWLWLFNPEPLSIQIVSETSEKCYNGTKNSLMGKIEFAYQQLEPHLKQSVTFKGRPAVFENPNTGTVILGSATTDSVARGTTYSIVWLDEIAFYGNLASNLYTSCVPLTNCLLMCSTPNGANFFKWLVDETKKGILPYSLAELAWNVHPERTEEYIETKRKQLPKAQFAKEYGLSFDMSQEGTIFNVKEGMLKSVNLVEKLNNGYRLVYGADFGMGDDTSFIFGLCNEGLRDLIIFGDYTKNNDIPERHYENMIMYLEQFGINEPMLKNALGYCDPAGTQRNLTNGRTVYESYVNLGLRGMLTAERMEVKDAMVEMQRWFNDDKFSISLSAADLHNNIILCHYPQDKHGRITDFEHWAHEGKGICNFNSHKMDALKYLLTNITATMRGEVTEIKPIARTNRVVGVGRR